MTIEPDGVVITAILVGFGAGAWATTITIQIVGIKRRLSKLEHSIDAFLQRLEKVAPYLARGQRVSDRSGP